MSGDIITIGNRLFELVEFFDHEQQRWLMALNPIINDNEGTDI